jgi:[CysO sulfur-carrier protein]-S-L-cysteine hydrolase
MSHNAEEFPWINGAVVFTQAAIDAIDADAQRGLAVDEECCGLVAGLASDALRADRVTPFENRANKLHAVDPETFTRTGREYFDMHPMKFARAVEEGAKAGLPVKVLYHSHLDCGAYFSPTDAAAATGNTGAPLYPLAYLVVSIRAGGVIDDRKLFVWSETTATFVEAAYTVEA